MISVFTDKEVTLNFNIDIEGNKSLPEAKMILNLDSGVSIGIKAKITEKTAKVTIPPLKHILKNTDAKVVSSILEVIADGAYFTPWKDTCELKESIQVNVNDDIKIEETTEKISIKAEMKEEEAKPEVKIELFNETNTKNKLIEHWNKYRKITESNDVSINNQYSKGYFTALDNLVKKLKETINTISKEEASEVIRSSLREAIKMTTSSEGLSKTKKEYAGGYYSGVFDIMSTLE